MFDRHLFAGLDIDDALERRIGPIAHFDGVAAGGQSYLRQWWAFTARFVVNVDIAPRRDGEDKHRRLIFDPVFQDGLAQQGGRTQYADDTDYSDDKPATVATDCYCYVGGKKLMCTDTGIGKYAGRPEVVCAVRRRSRHPPVLGSGVRQWRTG
jgi:hypothetical protein